MPHSQDQINGADLFSSIRRALGGSKEEMAASRERLAKLSAARPQPSDVFPQRLGLDSLHLEPDWGAERLTARPALYDGQCPVCDGRGYYMPRGQGHIDAERPCRCGELRRLAERVESVGVPPDLHQATWKGTEWGRHGPKADHLHEQIASHCHAFAQARMGHEEGARSLILEGPTGSGKSHLAALCALVASSAGRSVRWLYWPDLVELISAGISSRRAGAGVDSIYARLLKPFDIVVLDDLGAGRTPPWIDQVWEGIVGRRSSMRRTIIATTNYRREQIEAAAGARTSSRLYGHADTMTVDGPDQRLNGGK